MPNKRVDSSFLDYYHPTPAAAPQPPPKMPQQPRSGNTGYAFNHPNARQQSPMPRTPQPAYTPQPQQQQQRQQSRPYVPNIQVSRPPSPPKAAFVSLPTQSEKLLASPVSVGPQSPNGRKGSAGSEEDDRYGSVVGSQTAHMDFWKRFSMTLHDKEMEEKGLKKKQNAWLNKQFEGNRKWKIIVWSLAVVILIVIGATLAWHFTRPDKSNVTVPTTHDFGLSPEASSANPLKSLTVNAGPAKRTALPQAHLKRMAKLRKMDAVA